MPQCRPTEEGASAPAPPVVHRSIRVISSEHAGVPSDRSFVAGVVPRSRPGVPGWGWRAERPAGRTYNLSLMSSQAALTSQVIVKLCSPEDRKLIYAARHDVYANELHQHHANSEGILSDALDERNEYIVVKQARDLLGFVSVTPPGGAYSVDKYFSRDLIPIAFDQSLFEVRLLTVLSAHRGRIIAPLLMYGALRYVESRGGSKLVAIGRREVVSMYSRCGMEPTGQIVQSGAVEYELMTGSTRRVQRAIVPLSRSFERLAETVDWQLPFPINRGCALLSRRSLLGRTGRRLHGSWALPGSC